MLETPLMTPSLADALVRQAGTMPPCGLNALQKERLLILVDYARQHSPYLREKYRDIPVCPDLEDIPVMLRQEAMPRLDSWVCDPEITAGKLDDYLANLDESSVSQPFLGRYRVLTTSGTTGIPLRMVRDDRHNLIHSALLSQRLIGGGKARNSSVPMTPFPRMAGVLAGGGYHSTYLSYLRTKKAYEDAGRGGDIIPLFVDMSTDEMVARLNDFQPAFLSGYPSNIRLLASRKRSGKLTISPGLIACSAEHLSREDIHYIEESFGCPVLNNYCSTEGGEVAMLCSENHMHVNTDWVIVEPVDQDMRPVPPGMESSGLLMTNLANLVQPVIRYYVSDQIVLGDAPCACGSPFPTIEIEGRKEDILSFRDDEGQWVALPSSLFITISMHVPNCGQVQFIQRKPRELEMRCTPEDGSGHAELRRALLLATTEKLALEGLGGLTIVCSPEKPILGKTGKMRNTLRLTDG
ncbi:phenylacetate--CoA ligase family protein [Bacillota bacterium Meth-B3]|nr:hypothetical protein [Christensenellaceae bacterium]MEA5065685.1 hypothetical protein [Eubacteriales bacterium]